MQITDVIAAGAFVTFLAYWARQKSNKKVVNLPPGPKPIPVLGNIRDLTGRELWLPAAEWAKKYGDVVYLHIFGQGLVFLDSFDAASELLDAKGNIYSDKPPMVMLGDLCGCERMVAFTRYGDRARRQRKLMNKALGASAIPSYTPLLEREANSFLRRLLGKPNAYEAAIRRYAGGLTLQVVYGYEASEHNDYLLTISEESVDILANEITSGGGIWLVDLIPALQNLPSWFPGAGFKRKAQAWRTKLEEVTDKPFEFFKSTFKSGEYVPSFCSNIFEDNEKMTPEQEFDIKWTANSMFVSSIDTTLTAFTHFLIAMMQYPEVLKRAQTEIDSVCSGRLPTFADRASLPYLEAVFNETLRIACPVPLNLPHRLMEDDVYRGMFIPKGSLVFGNIWSMTRDEAVFPDPHAFKPERYLEEVDTDMAKKRDPKRYVYGFGRRNCPGQHLVEWSLWILFARVLATLDIKLPLDEQGNKILPEVEFTNSFFRSPSAFEVDIKPRSASAVHLINLTETM